MEAQGPLLRAGGASPAAAQQRPDARGSSLASGKALGKLAAEQDEEPRPKVMQTFEGELQQQQAGRRTRRRREHSQSLGVPRALCCRPETVDGNGALGSAAGEKDGRLSAANKWPSSKGCCCAAAAAASEQPRGRRARAKLGLVAQTVADCAKCQLLVSWTLAQSRIISEQQRQASRQEQPRARSRPARRGPEVAREADLRAELSSLASEHEQTSSSPKQTASSPKQTASSLERPDVDREGGPEVGAQRPSSAALEARGGARDKVRRPAPQPPEVADCDRASVPLARASVPPARSTSRDGNNNELGESGSGSGSSKSKSGEDEGDPKGDGTKDDRLLAESEVQAVELLLRSHKSAVYVCGCMANLYLTSTQLVDNGRSSRPEQNGWRLSRTGIPVLVFDSGLAKNRQRKRLGISLAERGSGFVLWSDTIDHLSNYRAYSSREHGAPTGVRPALSQRNQRQSTVQDEPQTRLGQRDGLFAGSEKEHNKPEENTQERAQMSNEETCHTFHVMYLSSNHRVMAGLSFDDATCARLFLAQVELVCSDPANIALSGPKLASSAPSWPPAAEPNRDAELAHHGKLAAGAPAHSLRVSRFLSSFRRPFGLRAAQAARRPPEEQQPAGAGSWSTLKRALRGRAARGSLWAASAAERRQGAAAGESPQSVRGWGASKVADPRTALLEASFAPRPLAQLAAAGHTWRRRPHTSASARLLPRLRPLAARRSRRNRRPSTSSSVLPQKSDISAPCLFQHVISVNSATLQSLYSKSLLPASATTATTTTNQRPLPPPQAHTPPRPPPRAHCEAEEAPPASPPAASLDQTSQQEARRQAKSKACSLSSSSSCYSSASISPTSSEHGVQQRLQVRLMNEHMARRRLGASIASAHKQLLAGQRRPQIPPPAPPTLSCAPAEPRSSSKL